jgi:hypothetical protein
MAKFLVIGASLAPDDIIALRALKISKIESGESKAG